MAMGIYDEIHERPWTHIYIHGHPLIFLDAHRYPLMPFGCQALAPWVPRPLGSPPHPHPSPLGSLGSPPLGPLVRCVLKSFKMQPKGIRILEHSFFGLHIAELSIQSFRYSFFGIPKDRFRWDRTIRENPRIPRFCFL